MASTAVPIFGSSRSTAAATSWSAALITRNISLVGSASMAAEAGLAASVVRASELGSGRIQETKRAGRAAALSARFSQNGLCAGYALKLLPQPQVDFTCGLLNLNPEPSRVST